MEGIVQYVRTRGLVALVLVMLAENLFPPIPSEAVLPLAGYLVSAGEMNFLAALLAATAGSLIGAFILYALGRYEGRHLLLRYRWLFRVTEEELDRADHWFDTHGPKLVFFARMVPLARSIVSLPAGASEMPVLRFTLLTVAGSAIWNALLIAIGRAVGERYDEVAHTIDRFSTPIGILVGLGIAGLFGWWWWRHRNRDV